jgi:uncharacterized protein YbcI
VTGTLATDEAMLMAVNAAMARLHDLHHKRSPAQARTLLLDSDLLVSVLTGIYTRVEKTMIELGRQAVVRETRAAFDGAMQREFIAEVERVFGRRVVAFISSHHVAPDLEVKIFQLQPVAESVPSAAK